MNSENKIVVTSWNGKSWEMTHEQIEAAYRYKERQYRIDDAYNQLELNADWIEDKYGYAACFGVEVKCKTFGEYMKMIDRIAGSCDEMERGE